MMAALTLLFLVFFFLFFFFNDTATTEIYTLSLHDALPICGRVAPETTHRDASARYAYTPADRKSTRLNSSHVEISYAVFCLKKKKYKDNISSELRAKLWTHSSRRPHQTT